MTEPNLLADFIAICDEDHVSTKKLDLIAYTSDLASLPRLIKQMYNIKTPQYIIRPSSSEQISKILKIATQYKIPFTSRAGVSSGTGAAIPIDGGIVLDLTQMRTIISIDTDFAQVTVQPGITWYQLNFILKKYGYMTGIYPSSAPSATVGGFVSTGGYAGIGTPKYGTIGRQIQKLKIILPNGKESEVYPPLTSLFIGAEGTLGIITEITLRIYPQSQVIFPIAFGFNDLEPVILALETVINRGIKPYYTVIFDKCTMDIFKSLGLEIPHNNFVVLLTLEGHKEEVSSALKEIRPIFGEKHELPEEFARNEWRHRFNAELSVKRAGPSLILLEIGVLLKDLSQIYKLVQNEGTQLHRGIGFFSILGHGASLLCMPFILADERNGMDYLKLLLFSRKFLSKAIKLGSQLYGIGLWGGSYLSAIYKKEKLTIFRDFKKVLDEFNLCNPGKITEDRTPERIRPVTS
ncbi:MAG: FAD-binding oxidoreductase [Candidatus Helarchaeota archaeon]